MRTICGYTAESATTDFRSLSGWVVDCGSSDLPILSSGKGPLPRANTNPLHHCASRKRGDAMSSHTMTLSALARDERSQSNATAAYIDSLLDASTAPKDSDIATLADRHMVATATALLLETLRPFTPNGQLSESLLSLFLSNRGSHQTQLHAFLCGVKLGCFPDRGDYLPDPLGKLRARKDPRAMAARYACGDLRDWRRADRISRATILLRKLVSASIELRGRHG
jgi:hypothetical protein